MWINPIKGDGHLCVEIFSKQLEQLITFSTAYTRYPAMYATVAVSSETLGNSVGYNSNSFRLVVNLSEDGATQSR